MFLITITVFREIRRDGQKVIECRSISGGKESKQIFETSSFSFRKVKEAVKIFVANNFPEASNKKFSFQRDIDNKNHTGVDCFSSFLGEGRRRVIL